MTVKCRTFSKEYPLLSINDIQSMQYKLGDPGPFYLNEEEKRKQKHDCCISEEKDKKKYTKGELRTKIFEPTKLQPPPNTSLEKMQEITTANNIPIEYEIDKIKEGWLGKPKGMLQVLCERGFIDFEVKDMKKVVSFYTIKGKKDDNNNNAIIPGSSLCDITKNLPDFKAELTLLQFRAQQLGVSLQCSPKYHPEIAGEGIEYAWGCSKNYYCRLPMKEKKKSKERFRELVSDAIDTKNNLTPSQI